MTLPFEVGILPKKIDHGWGVFDPASRDGQRAQCKSDRGEDLSFKSKPDMKIKAMKQGVIIYSFV